MKQSIKTLLLIALFSSFLYGCGPASVNSFAGTWTTNIGRLSFSQNGDEVTGLIEGYGGFWNENFTGTVDENGNAAFSTEWFGDFTLIIEQDTFKSKSNELSFCGVRSEKTEELPAGCGFSGKWLVPSKFIFLPNSYMILKQVGAQVTGNLYDGSDNIYDSFTGEVDWGKGWRVNGTSTQRGELSLWINTSETGFEFIYGSQPNSSQLCAVREGQSSAYLGSYTCTP